MTKNECFNLDNNKNRRGSGKVIHRSRKKGTGVKNDVDHNIGEKVLHWYVACC